MKKLLICMLIGMICLSGCGTKDTEPEVEVETEDMAEENTSTEISKESAENNAYIEEPVGDGSDKIFEGSTPEDEDILKQCLDKAEQTVLPDYPAMAINGVVIDRNWTVKDFIENRLADSLDEITVTAATESNGDETLTPSLEELKAGMNGYKVELKGKDFVADFDYAMTEFFMEPSLAALDAPLSSIRLLDGFDCGGVVPKASIADVANTLGVTKWGGLSLDYSCEPESQMGAGSMNFMFTEMNEDTEIVNVPYCTEVYVRFSK